MNYILDEQKNPVLVPDTHEGWERYMQFRQAGDKVLRVAATTIGSGWVSTVFLGIDHSFTGGPPVLWETMVFNIPGFENECVRYTSHADAVEGHAAMVDRIRGPFLYRMLAWVLRFFGKSA